MAKPQEQLTDEELIAEFQRENEDAFIVLVGRFKDPLTNFLFRMLGNREDCNDAVQETFVRLYTNRNAYKPLASFSTWLHTVAINVARNALRKRKIRRWIPLGIQDRNETYPHIDVADEDARSDERAESGIRDELIQKALNSLSDKNREVIVLREIEELSYEEISAITGLNLGTVKSRINRGRADMQKSLKHLWEEL